MVDDEDDHPRKQWFLSKEPISNQPMMIEIVVNGLEDDPRR